MLKLNDAAKGLHFAVDLANHHGWQMATEDFDFMAALEQKAALLPTLTQKPWASQPALATEPSDGLATLSSNPNTASGVSPPNS
jgi:hypothetical protein